MKILRTQRSLKRNQNHLLELSFPMLYWLHANRYVWSIENWFVLPVFSVLVKRYLCSHLWSLPSKTDRIIIVYGKFISDSFTSGP
jgi:hypothetical protein